MNVPTPRTLSTEAPLCEGDRSKVASIVKRLLSENGHWTKESIGLLSPLTIFEYDRLKSYIDIVFGSKHSPLISPLHALCLESGCSTPVITLKSFNDLSRYEKHLEMHMEKPDINDASFSSTMLKRLKASYLFSTEAEIDKLCPIRACLVPMDDVSDRLRQGALAFRIERDFDGHFMAKWLSVIFENRLIESNHIIYQELSALVQTALSFPNPMTNWGTHRTLFLHSLAAYTSTPLLAYKLIRGQPESNPKKKGSDVDENKNLAKRLSDQNHFYPSPTCLWRQLPPISFKTVTKQPKYVEAHYHLLASNSNAVCFKSDKYQRYPVTIVCDEQPISQTTFLYEENSRQYLLGLDRPLTMGSVIEMGGMDKVMEMISKGDLKYIQAVLEFRVIDVTGTHCSNPMTIYLTDQSKSDQFYQYVEEAVKLVNTCNSCRQSGTECVFLDRKGACISCTTKKLICEGFVALALVCDMGKDHIAVEAKIEKIIPMVYGIYHVAKAITNHIRNKTIILNNSYFSIQTLMSLYAKSLDTGTSIGTLSRTVFNSTDRQSDKNSYMLCCKQVRLTLAFHKYTTFQRYPDIYQGPKSFFQTHLGNVTQIFPNKNGEIFWVEEDGVFAISHHVLCQKKQITMEGDFKAGLYGIVLKKRTIKCRNGDLKEEVTEHLYSLSNGTLRLFTHLQKSQEGAKSPIKILQQLELYVESERPMAAKFCSSGLDSLLLAECIPGHVFIYILSPLKLWPSGNKKRINQVVTSLQVKLDILCSMLLELEDNLIDCRMKPFVGGGFVILCLSNQRITLFDSSGTVIRDMKTTGESLWILPFGQDCNKFATVTNGKQVLVYEVTSGKKMYSFGIEDVSQIGCVTSYGESIIISGTNLSTDNDKAIFITTSLQYGLQFCKAIEDLYNCVGFSSSAKSFIPKNSLPTTFVKSSGLSSTAMAVLEEFKVQRKSLFRGSLQSAGAIGFIHEQTLRCMSKTVEYIKKAEELFLVAENPSHARIDCMVNELYVEGFFGDITQSLTGESADLHDYIYRKRKLEISSIIKNCSKSFVFKHNTNKMYTTFRQCDIDAWDAIDILRSAEYQPLVEGSMEPKATAATNKFMAELHSRTKGQRCRASRSNHKKIAMTAPYQVFDYKNKAKKQKQL